MPHGVSENFLSVARREERLGRRAALAAVALAPAAAFLAELADEPAYGPVWGLFVASALLGLVLGALLARRRLARYEDALRLRWDHWMRGSVGAWRLGEVARRAAGHDPPLPLLPGASALGLAALNLALFALLWAEHPAAPAIAGPLVALDGLLLGGLAATSALTARWAKEFLRAAEELVRRGEVPMWGER